MTEYKDYKISQSDETVNNKAPINKELNEDEFVTDLKSSLKDSILNTSDLLEELLSSIDNSVNDVDIKNASKKIILEINKELSAALDNTVDKISEQNKEVNLKYAFKTNSEEE
jgi:hypothetical protein